MSKSAKYRAILAFTALIIFLLLAEWVRRFNGIDTWVDLVLPSGGSFVHLLTDTASFVAVALYVLAFLLWDVVKGGKLSRPTLELILSLIVAMLVVGLLKVLTGVPPRPPRRGRGSLGPPRIAEERRLLRLSLGPHDEGRGARLLPEPALEKALATLVGGLGDRDSLLKAPPPRSLVQRRPLRPAPRAVGLHAGRVHGERVASVV